MQREAADSNFKYEEACSTRRGVWRSRTWRGRGVRVDWWGTVRAGFKMRKERCWNAGYGNRDFLTFTCGDRAFFYVHIRELHAST